MRKQRSILIVLTMVQR